MATVTWDVSVADSKRIIGLTAGTLLLFLGGLGMWIAQSSYANPMVQRFCDAWYCPDEFSPARIFELSQKATLGDPQGQLSEFQRALLSDSASAYRWADLGDSEVNIHNLPKATFAFQQALKAGPRSPVILLRAANFYFEAGEPDKALAQLAKILKDPDLSDYYETVFLTYSRLGLPVSEILTQGIPERTEVGSRFLRFWINAGREDEAKQTWAWLSSHGSPNEASVAAYINFLISKHEDILAADTWREYTRQSAPDYGKTNWVFNGGFESPFKQSALDWTAASGTGIDVERVRTQSSEGEWSLQMQFHATNNLDYRQTFQSVVLTPGNWRFSAKVKTLDITTNEGPQFHLSGLERASNIDVWTQPQIGTTDWHDTNAQFHVGPSPTVVKIEILRVPSTHFDNKVSGIAWIDEVKLTPEGVK